jgi:hypothetical protein
LPAFDNLSVAHQHVDNTAISIEMIETAATSTLSPSPMPRQLVSSASDPGLLDWKPVKPYSPSQDKLVSPRLVRQSTGVETVISEAAASLYSDAHNDDVAHDESAAPVVNRSASQCSIASDSFDPNSQSVNTFASLVSSVTSARVCSCSFLFGSGLGFISFFNVTVSRCCVDVKTTRLWRRTSQRIGTADPIHPIHPGRDCCAHREQEAQFSEEIQH